MSRHMDYDDYREELEMDFADGIISEEEYKKRLRELESNHHDIEDDWRELYD